MTRRKKFSNVFCFYVLKVISRVYDSFETKDYTLYSFAEKFFRQIDLWGFSVVLCHRREGKYFGVKIKLCGVLCNVKTKFIQTDKNKDNRGRVATLLATLTRQEKKNFVKSRKCPDGEDTEFCFVCPSRRQNIGVSVEK